MQKTGAALCTPNGSEQMIGHVTDAVKFLAHTYMSNFWELPEKIANTASNQVITGYVSMPNECSPEHVMIVVVACQTTASVMVGKLVN